MSGSDDTGGYTALIFFRASAITPNNIPIIVYNAKANSLQQCMMVGSAV
jgi:hypothetical protein